MTKQRIHGLADIASQFDGMIIDQYGIIHDGHRLYPGAAEVMRELHRAGIAVAIVTNSGKRAAANVARIEKMGIPREHFLGCVSSGEVAFQTMSTTRAFVFGKHGEDYGLDGITLVDDPHDADVLLFMGSDAPRTSMKQYSDMLQGLTLPAICCNPDKWMVSPQGLLPAAGAVAALYETMGGKVTWIGKPYPGIYHAAQKLMPGAQRVLCIGDSAEHDVAGGRSAGLATLLVQQGVSADVREADIHPCPDYIMESFVWRG